MNTFKTKPLTKIQVFSILLSSIFINNLSALPFVTTLDDCNSLYKSQKYREYIDSCADYAKEDLATKWNFSQIYALGAAGLKNPQLAAFYAEDPAKAGVVEAISALCNDYTHGIGVKQDYERSVWWCLKGANQGDYYSMLQGGYLYEYGLGTAKNSNKAISFYLNVANHDNAYTSRAQHDLSRVYFSLGAANYPDAYYWLKKAYLQKNPDAITQIEIMQNKITQCDFKNIYFDSDLSYADALNACNGGNLTTTNATSNTSIINEPQTTYEILQLAKGYYENKDYSGAFYWYQKAADQGNAIAQFILGFMYERNLVVPKEKLNIVASMTLQSPNAIKALYWYQKAAEQGYAEAQFNLGGMYRGAQNYKEAIYWYQKAADQGYAEAQYGLGLMYSQGQGVPQDYNKAVYWYQKAADQGDGGAQLMLGRMYIRGFHIPIDYKKAIYWYQKAADQGYAEAQLMLGNMYALGTIVTTDYKKATYWFQKAAEQGNAGAQYQTGRMYEGGLGVAKNITKALYWYQKAADQGLPGGIDALKRLR